MKGFDFHKSVIMAPSDEDMRRSVAPNRENRSFRHKNIRFFAMVCSLTLLIRQF